MEGAIVMFNAEISYKQYIVDWLKGKRYSISQQTYQVNESYIRNQITPMLGDYSLSQLNPIILQQFVNELMDKGLANSSVKRIFSIVFSSLDMAEKTQLIPKNYASLVHKPKLRRKELQVWDVSEVQQFLTLASKDPYTYLAFHLGLLTGMRQGEILGLRWIDIDFENTCCLSDKP
jgi:integrase